MAELGGAGARLARAPGHDPQAAGRRLGPVRAFPGRRRVRQGQRLHPFAAGRRQRPAHHRAGAVPGRAAAGAGAPARPAGAPRRAPARAGLRAAGQHLRAGRRARPRAAHRPDRPARRRQVHAGCATGSRAGRALRRTRPRDRARGRHRHERDPAAARPGRLPPLRAPRAVPHRRGARRRRGHDHRRQHRQRARDLRPAAKPLLLRLAQGQPGRAHEPRGGAGRHAPVRHHAAAPRQRGDGRHAPHPGQPRNAVRARRCRGRHRGAQRQAILQGPRAAVPRWPPAPRPPAPSRRPAEGDPPPRIPKETAQ